MELEKVMLFFSCFHFTDHEQIFKDTQQSILHTMLEVWSKISFLIHGI